MANIQGLLKCYSNSFSCNSQRNSLKWYYISPHLEGEEIDGQRS